ncbi:MAG: biopolymer transporter ExbD [Bdellovibrionaceae bacterium]|nr:biopolymer transporter ExbD [Pseudobdellovibrionaceae bacterium]
MRHGILSTQMLKSPLLQQKRVHGVGGGGKSKSLLFSMNLTTLIDAFCILVIFLLSNMNGQLQNIEVGKNTVLPTATVSEIMSAGVVIRMENNEIYIEDKKIAVENIVQSLIDHKTEEKNSLIIQADKNSDYDKISLLLRAGGQAGFEKYAFAVLPGTYAATK